MIRDREIIELLREEPELLAVADAVGTTQRARLRRSASVPRRRAIALAGLGIAAVLVVVFALGRGGAPSIVDRALAAVGEGPVLHAITRMADPNADARVELATGREVAPATLEVEMWLDEGRGVLHVITRRDGRVVVDRAVRSADYAGDLYEGMSDPFQLAGLYRRMLDEGGARETGSGTLLGRPVVWLEARAPAAGDPSKEVVWRAALDSETSRLLALRVLVGGKPEIDLDVLRLEALAEGSHVFPRPGAYDLGTGTLESGLTATLAQAREALPVPAVWAGNEVAGERLYSFGIFTRQSDSADSARVRGVSVSYGEPRGLLGNAITVSQVPVGASDDEDPPPPPGLVDLSMSETGQSAQSVVWSGRLEHQGLWITVTAPSREAVLEVARALRPIP